MKKKKVLDLLVIVLICLTVLVGCGSGAKEPVDNEGEKVFKIGISQLAEHPALDDNRQGFEDGLKELGIKAEISYQNAQGETPNTLTIAQKFVKDDMDLIFAIGTASAQSAKQATSDIPILFSAVTDPVKSEIVNSWEDVGGNITGTSDQAPIESQLKMFKEIDSAISTIGILYNTSETNSEIQIEEVKELAPKIGLEIVTIGVNSVNELSQALDSIIKKVDALYMVSDNMVAASVELVRDKTIKSKTITVSAEESQVRGGLLITNGLSYYELGKQTAQIAKEVLLDNKDISTIPVGIAETTITTVNEQTLKALDLDKDLPLFKDSVKVGN